MNGIAQQPPPPPPPPEQSSQCPICNDHFDTKRKRFIIESCGHQKCRNCMIQEENGCSLCLIKKETNHHQTDQVQHNKKGNSQENLMPSSSPICIDNDNNNNNNNNNNNTNNLINQFCDNQLKTAETTINSNDNIKIISNITIKRTTDVKERKKQSIVGALAMPNINNKQTKKRIQSKNKKEMQKTMENDNHEKIPKKHKKNTKNIVEMWKRQRQHQHHQQKYTCDICKLVYVRFASLRRHMKIHTTGYKYNCMECKCMFMNREQYTAHMNKHKNIYAFNCIECGRHFSFKSNWKKHLITHKLPAADNKLFSCSHCPKKYTRQSTLKIHLNSHFPDRKRPYICPRCPNQLFFENRSYIRHLQIHKDKESYFCTICLVKIKRKDNILRHIRNIHPTVNFNKVTMEICANYKKLQNDLRNHQNKSSSNGIIIKQLKMGTKNYGIANQNDKKNVKRKLNKSNGNENEKKKSSIIIEQLQNQLTDQQKIKNTCSVIKFIGKTIESICSITEKPKEIGNQSKTTSSTLPLKLPSEQFQQSSQFQPSSQSHLPSQFQLSSHTHLPSRIPSMINDIKLPNVQMDFPIHIKIPTDNKQITKEQQYIYRQLLSPHIKSTTTSSSSSSSPSPSSSSSSIQIKSINNQQSFDQLNYNNSIHNNNNNLFYNENYYKYDDEEDDDSDDDEDSDDDDNDNIDVGSEYNIKSYGRQPSPSDRNINWNKKYYNTEFFPSTSSSPPSPSPSSSSSISQLTELQPLNTPNNNFTVTPEFESSNLNTISNTIHNNKKKIDNSPLTNPMQNNYIKNNYDHDYNRDDDNDNDYKTNKLFTINDDFNQNIQRNDIKMNINLNNRNGNGSGYNQSQSIMNQLNESESITGAIHWRKRKSQSYMMINQLDKYNLS